MVRQALRVELIYDRACPNVERARSMLRAALATIGTTEPWIEWDREHPSTPEHLRNCGSPTVLVNGHDIGCDENEAAQSDANSCRVYIDGCGCLCGAPSSELIIDAIRRVTP